MLSAAFSLAGSAGAPPAAQRSIRPDFGAIAAPRGASLLVLSSGTAAAVGDTDPAYAAPAPGTDQGTTSTAPADYLTAHGGQVPIHPGCPAPIDASIYDSVMLTLSVRVPTNARAFTLRAFFLTAEYPELVCSPYDDAFVSLLGSGYAGDPPNPADQNLATYVDAIDGVHPLSVGIAYGNTGLFQQCVDGPTGCDVSAVNGTMSTCAGTDQLAGTGLDEADPGKCHGMAIAGGGTGWLRIAGNVVPGETMQLRLALWDAADAIGDSHVLLDAFRWQAEPLTPGMSLAD